MSRNSLVLCALLLGGCDKMAVGNRTERTGDTHVGVANATQANVSEAPEGVGAPMAWRVVDGAAFYGAANQPPVFALRCERASGSILFERAGGGTALNLSAGGAGASLGTRAAAGDRVQARTSMSDAVLDAMARSQAQISVSGGTDTLIIPGGVAIRRVIDFCRNPPAPAAPPVDNAIVLPANAVAPAAPAPVAVPTPAASGGQLH